MRDKFFEVKVQATVVRFSIPKAYCDSLSLKGEDDIFLTIKNMDNQKIYSGWKKLKSGLEIYGADIRKAGIIQGQKIRVRASRNQEA